MRVHIKEQAHGLKLRTLFESFFDDLVLTSIKPDMVVDMRSLSHGDKHLQLSPGRELITLYRYLETLTPSKTRWGTLLGVRPLKKVHQLVEETCSEEDIRKHLHEDIGIEKDKIDLLLEILQVQRPIYEAHRDHLSLFISIPFCPSICSYCNFHTKPYQRKLAERYLERLRTEINYLQGKLRESSRILDLIYIGGGTPSALDEDLFTDLLEALRPLTEHVIEYTIEAGRLDSLTEEKIERIKEHATRVCLNPQSLHPKTLQGINRPFSVDLKELIHHFEQAGLNVNADLIAGLPGETPSMFSQSLEKLISYDPREITVHNLSLKRGSELKHRDFLAEDVSLMLKEGYEMLKANDYHPYYIYRQKNMLGHGENVGYSKEAPCIYNIRMMEDAHEIIALGSNATSKYLDDEGLHRIQSIKETTLWIEEEVRSLDEIDRFFRRG